MKSAVTAVAVVFMLLASVLSASAARDFNGAQWRVETPAPEGQLTADVLIAGQKPPGLAGTLLVSLSVRHPFFGGEDFQGEARIPELAISAGEEPGCPLFFDPSNEASIPLDPAVGEFFFQFTLLVHSHPGSDCSAGDLSLGRVGLVLIVPEAEFPKDPLDLEIEIVWH